MATNSSITSDAPLKSNRISKLWDKLNNALDYAPKFQNKNRPGVDEKTIKNIESKLGITLPKQIRDVVKVHDGRDHIQYGFTFRLATTDLLPIANWRPYEKVGEGSLQMLFNCLANENDRCADKNLCDDFQDHWTAYSDATKNAKKSKNKKRKIEYDPETDEAFQALPCELLVIGEGADDYVEQYLLSIRSGRIYLAVHNIPEWKLIGTFSDWINMGLKNAVDDKEDIQEMHDEI